MKIRKDQLFWHVFLLTAVLITIFPILFAISNSFKTLAEANNFMMRIIPQDFTLENFRYIFTKVDIKGITLNTLIIALVVTLSKLSTSLLAAYAFVFMDWKHKNVVYFFFIATIFIPFTVVMIPNFLTISKLNLKDTLMGVALPQLADAMGIFLLRQTMKTIPKSLIEYATIESVRHMRILRDIVIPLVKPSIISTGIIFFINSWNEYVWPVLILRSKANYTLSLALQMYINSEGGTDFTIAMAISVLTMIIPLILFVVFQRQIMSTFASSGVKG